MKGCDAQQSMHPELTAGVAGSLGLHALALHLGAAVIHAHEQKAPVTLLFELPRSNKQLETFLHSSGCQADQHGSSSDAAAVAAKLQPERVGELHGCLEQAFASSPWGHAAQIFHVPVLLLAYGLNLKTATQIERLVAHTLQMLLQSRFATGSTLLALSRDLVCNTVWPVHTVPEVLHAGRQLDVDRQSALEGVHAPGADIICGFLLDNSNPRYRSWVTNAQQPRAWVSAAMAAKIPAAAAATAPKPSGLLAVAGVSNKSCSHASAATSLALGQSRQAQRIAVATAAAAAVPKAPTPTKDMWLHEQVQAQSAPKQLAGVLVLDQRRHYSAVRAATAAVLSVQAVNMQRADPGAVLQNKLGRMCNAAAQAVAAVGAPSESLAGISAAAEYAAKHAEGKLRSLATCPDGKKLLHSLAHKRPDDELGYHLEFWKSAQSELKVARQNLSAAHAAAEERIVARSAAHAAYVQAAGDDTKRAAASQQLADAQKAALAACSKVDDADTAVEAAQQQVHRAREQLRCERQPLEALKAEVQGIGAAAMKAAPLQRREWTTAAVNACILMALLNLTDYPHFMDVEVRSEDDLALLLLRPCFWLLFCLHSILLIDHPRPACVLNVDELLSDELLWAAACEQWLPYEEVLVEWIEILQRACESLEGGRTRLQGRKAVATEAAAVTAGAAAAAGAIDVQHPKQLSTAQHRVQELPADQQQTSPAGNQQQQLAVHAQEQPVADKLLFGEYADFKQLLASAMYPGLQPHLRLLPLRRLLMHTVLMRVERAPFLPLGLPFDLRHQLAPPSALAQVRLQYQAHQHNRANDPVRQHNEGYGQSGTCSFKAPARQHTAISRLEDRSSPARPSLRPAAALATSSAEAAAPTNPKTNAAASKRPKAHPKLAGVRGVLQSTKCRLQTGEAYLHPRKPSKPSNPRELDSDADSSWGIWQKQAAAEAAAAEAAAALNKQAPPTAQAAAVMSAGKPPKPATVNPFMRVKKLPSPKLKQVQQCSQLVAQQLTALGLDQLGLAPGCDASPAAGIASAAQPAARGVHGMLFDLLQFKMPAPATTRRKPNAAAASQAPPDDVLELTTVVKRHSEPQAAEQQLPPSAAFMQQLQHPAAAPLSLKVGAAVTRAPPSSQQQGISWPAHGHIRATTAADMQVPSDRQPRPADCHVIRQHQLPPQQQQQCFGVTGRTLVCEVDQLACASRRQLDSAAVRSCQQRPAPPAVVGGPSSASLLFDDAPCSPSGNSLRAKITYWPPCSQGAQVQTAQPSQRRLLQQEAMEVQPQRRQEQRQDQNDTESKLVLSCVGAMQCSLMSDHQQCWQQDEAVESKHKQQQQNETVESELQQSKSSSEQPGYMSDPWSGSAADEVFTGATMTATHAAAVQAAGPAAATLAQTGGAPVVATATEAEQLLQQHPVLVSAQDHMQSQVQPESGSPTLQHRPWQASSGSRKQHRAPSQLPQQQHETCGIPRADQQLVQAAEQQGHPHRCVPLPPPMSQQQQQGISKPVGVRISIQAGIFRTTTAQQAARQLATSGAANSSVLASAGASAAPTGPNGSREQCSCTEAACRQHHTMPPVGSAAVWHHKCVGGAHAAQRHAIAALATPLAGEKKLQQLTSTLPVNHPGSSDHIYPAAKHLQVGDAHFAANASGVGIQSRIAIAGGKPSRTSSAVAADAADAECSDTQLPLLTSKCAAVACPRQLRLQAAADQTARLVAGSTADAVVTAVQDAGNAIKRKEKHKVGHEVCKGNKGGHKDKDRKSNKRNKAEKDKRKKKKKKRRRRREKEHDREERRKGQPEQLQAAAQQASPAIGLEAISSAQQKQMAGQQQEHVKKRKLQQAANHMVRQRKKHKSKHERLQPPCAATAAQPSSVVMASADPPRAATSPAVHAAAEAVGSRQQ